MNNGHIEVRDADVAAAFAELAQRLGDMTPAERAVAMALLSQTEANFMAEAGPLGPWPALQDPRPGGKILQDTGRMAGGVTPFWGGGEAGIGVNAIYAAIQQLGGVIHKAAQSRQVRHRTDAKGELLKSGALGGKGLVFAKDSHKRVLERWFEQAAHDIEIPARPFMPVTPDGQLQDGMDETILGILAKFVEGGQT